MESQQYFYPRRPWISRKSSPMEILPMHQHRKPAAPIISIITTSRKRQHHLAKNRINNEEEETTSTDDAIAKQNKRRERITKHFQTLLEHQQYDTRRLAIETITKPNTYRIRPRIPSPLDIRPIQKERSGIVAERNNNNHDRWNLSPSYTHCNNPLYLNVDLLFFSCTGQRLTGHWVISIGQPLFFQKQIRWCRGFLLCIGHRGGAWYRSRQNEEI